MTPSCVSPRSCSFFPRSRLNSTSHGAGLLRVEMPESPGRIALIVLYGCGRVNGVGVAQPTAFERNRPYPAIGVQPGVHRLMDKQRRIAGHLREPTEMPVPPVDHSVQQGLRYGSAILGERGELLAPPVVADPVRRHHLFIFSTDEENRNTHQSRRGPVPRNARHFSLHDDIGQSAVWPLPCDRLAELAVARVPEGNPGDGAKLAITRPFSQPIQDPLCDFHHARRIEDFAFPSRLEINDGDGIRGGGLAQDGVVAEPPFDYVCRSQDHRPNTLAPGRNPQERDRPGPDQWVVGWRVDFHSELVLRVPVSPRRNRQQRQSNDPSAKCQPTQAPFAQAVPRTNQATPCAEGPRRQESVGGGKFDSWCVLFQSYLRSSKSRRGLE